MDDKFEIFEYTCDRLQIITPGTALYSAAPPPREHDTTTQSRLGTTSIDQPSATPLKLAPPLVDRPLPAAAATDRPEEEDYKEEDGDDPTRPEIPDTEAESMAKNAILVTPILAFLQEYESAQVSPLSRLTLMPQLQSDCAPRARPPPREITTGCLRTTDSGGRRITAII
jgi:hypothetical protein